MKAQRAEEIASSPNMVNVTYNEESIYIEHVDEQNGTATIHPLDDPNKKQKCFCNQLKGTVISSIQSINLHFRVVVYCLIKFIEQAPHLVQSIFFHNRKKKPTSIVDLDF